MKEVCNPSTSVESPLLAKLTAIRLLAAVCAFTFLLGAVSASGQPINFTWTGGDGDWDVASNWSPEGIPGRSGTPDTRQDVATIFGNVAVQSAADIYFQGVAEGKSGSHNVLTLGNGASLDVTGNFRTWSWSGSTGAARNVLVNTGSALTVSGLLQVGAPASTNRTSTWTVHGTVAAEDFGGYKTTNDTSLISIGGYVLNIDGGSLSLSNEFNWNRNNTGNPQSIGEVYLSNGGVLTAGMMMDNWTSSSGNFVNFLDGTGSLTFGYTNFETVDTIESLIDQGFIRTGLAGGSFDISDTGTGWTVAVIPEPSTYAFMAALLSGLVVVFSRSRRRMG